MTDDRSRLLRLPATATAFIGVLGILAVGAIDYLSGLELRVVPLYYVPLSLVAWELGRRPVIAASVHVADARMYAAKSAGRNRVDVEIVGPASGAAGA